MSIWRCTTLCLEVKSGQEAKPGTHGPRSGCLALLPARHEASHLESPARIRVFMHHASSWHHTRSPRHFPHHQCPSSRRRRLIDKTAAERHPPVTPPLLQARISHTTRFDSIWRCPHITPPVRTRSLVATRPGLIKVTMHEKVSWVCPRSRASLGPDRLEHNLAPDSCGFPPGRTENLPSKPIGHQDEVFGAWRAPDGGRVALVRKSRLTCVLYFSSLSTANMSTTPTVWPHTIQSLE